MDQIVLSLLPDHRLAEAIAGELGLDVVRPKRGLAYLLRHASRIAVLVAPEGCPYARLYRWLNRRGRTLLVGKSHQCLIIRQKHRTTLLTSIPDGPDLPRWVNAELLPEMGFLPLATAFDDIYE